ncbi:hypothetical protein NUW58_g3616 [Xylaria curta]|uniref:Uncharacterized protein n=1 Tax=Xylaria curta TaxID=42375 RepID=A0ACC1PB43_9PEZI|nr:hypothetical protein NUW58_g3616 [Xylaria curta]
MSSRQKFALVTGCGRGGIGEALVNEYALRGLRPIATVLPCEDSDHLIQAGITCYNLDVTSEESIEDLKAKIFDLTNGFLDILVNNAGIAYTMPAIDSDVAEVQQMFDVNVFGPMRMVYHLHGMIIRSAGTIVNIGSIGGIIPYVYGAAYNGSKAALQHWSNTLRVEMAPLGVKVLTIISGEIGTNILKRDMGRELPKGQCLPTTSSCGIATYDTPRGTNSHPQIHIIPRLQQPSENMYSESQTLRLSPPAWYWYGKATLSVWILTVFGWSTIWDSIFWNMFGLGALQQYYINEGKKSD